MLLANDFRLPPVEMEASEDHKGKTIVNPTSPIQLPKREFLMGFAL